MTIHTINTLLIANRGEIAVRIMNTAQAMGIQCVAVYSEADAEAPFVQLADQAFCIGPAAATDSYLRVDKIMEVARQSGADAIHPGYGFLAENTELARQCQDAGIHFVGPPAEAIASMGSKSAAKELMGNAGVPLVPGYHGDDQSPEVFLAEAKKTGFPLLIKASAGGGGKGMRVVREPAEVKDAVAAAQREAKSSFGDAHLLIERYLENPRHVEVQVMFDQHGNGRYLFDRDCSVQRRHQKIIEEAPAPDIPDHVRREMGEAAVRCGEAIGYVNAGTVEFLYEPGAGFYFMEMNTRLQVEHPVTEMITGLDLVEWQLRVARNEPLPWTQDELHFQGHAMEARIYAEDPDNDFLPVTGTLLSLTEPHGMEGVRVDTGVREGQEISPWYDPMLSKVISYGHTRDEARQRLLDALSHYRAMGVTLNTDYVCRVLQHPEFAAARLTTHFIEQQAETLSTAAFDCQEQQILSWLAWQQASAREQRSAAPSPWTLTDSFRVGGPQVQLCEIRLGGEDLTLHYTLDGPCSARVAFSADSDPVTLRWQPDSQGEGVVVRLNGRSIRLGWASHGERLGVFANASHWEALVNHPEEQSADAAGDGILKAPMHGRITAVTCKVGDRVSAGTALVALEAMKMEHTLNAPADGEIAAIHCVEDDNVNSGQVLIEFTAEDAG
ncbi:acetyl/propionyl/methylcrotonyl-CoA carboxylase subunit alpha [Marinobacter sp. X15-166B]|uniref:acetyl/propionyl/methylcrotonyl-CoA carboxylase subunit alpha n=1 Tax=Marinobacter sp. X15-166B TaxID=1897620 RepID=UPI00085CDD2B|nr:biotin carboxylase N-terminal domain-containing protein [Marinobacter sp. X15-166B]OEY65526.1 3-methylcrotonyl-CoA carboxylase [Marinobacter sp. X15-166B]